ncbi:MAG: OmpA family protein [Thiotrichales bacterium]
MIQRSIFNGLLLTGMLVATSTVQAEDAVVTDAAAAPETPAADAGAAQAAPEAAPAGTLSGDQAALEALFSSTGGAGWESKVGWNIGAVCDQAGPGNWEGITCAGDPLRVTGLDLANRSLTGRIPTDIGKLDALQNLDLRENALEGEIPAQLGALVKLKFLRLDNNFLEGEIPVELSALTDLRSLDLHSNKLTGTIKPSLGPLAENLSVEGLDLRWNGLYGDDATIQALEAKQKAFDITSTQTIDAVGLRFEPQQNSILVSWTPVAYAVDAGGYLIDVYTGDEKFLRTVNVDGKDQDNKTVTGLNPRTQYKFKVRSFTNAHPENPNTIISDGKLGDFLLATTSIDLNADEDGDGINNRDEGYPDRDTDDDGTPDYLDEDDDNDGLTTKSERLQYESNPLAVDTDEDGIWDTDEKEFDSDNDGIPDVKETDDDGDGVLTKDEVAGDLNKNGRIDVSEFLDTDGDHIPNHQDDDDDGDGKATRTEVLGEFGIRTDSDGDAMFDYLDPNDSSITTSIGGGSLGLGVLALGGLGLLRRRRMRLPGALVIAVMALSPLTSVNAEEGLKVDTAELDFATKNESLSRGGRGYLGVGTGITQLDPDTGTTGFRVVDDSDVGLKVILGYEVTDHFSFEFSGGPLGESKLETSTNPVEKGNVDYRVYSAFGVINVLREREGFNPIVKIGVSQISNTASQNVPFERSQDLLLSAGIGLEYELPNQIAFRGEYEYFAEDAQAFMLSVLARFGGQKTVVIPPAAPPVVAAAPVTVEPAKVNVEFKIPDTDGDGVNDIRDACPNTPPGAEIDELGCAKFQGVLEGVNFEYNSSRLTPQAKAILNEVAEELKKYPTVKVQVQAHTDSTGSSGYNLWLSNNRAQSVIDYLSSLGIAHRRMIPVGYGETKPIASNATEEGRAANRRVQFEVMAGQ